jgi:hypothetical protein
LPSSRSIPFGPLVAARRDECPINMGYTCPINMGYTCPINMGYTCPINMGYTCPINMGYETVFVASGARESRFLHPL